MPKLSMVAPWTMGMSVSGQAARSFGGGRISAISGCILFRIEQHPFTDRRELHYRSFANWESYPFPYKSHI